MTAVGRRRWRRCRPHRPAQAALDAASRLVRRLRRHPGARDSSGVGAQLRAACPPAPTRGAAQSLAASSSLLVADSARTRRAARSTPASTTGRRRPSPRLRRGRSASRSAREAWFYLAGAYAPLVQWRVLRGERACRRARRQADPAKRSNARSRSIPSLTDAYFGIGLYHYYADVAPTAAKILRWLLFLPAATGAGPAGDAARRATTASCCAARPTTSCI